MTLRANSRTSELDFGGMPDATISEYDGVRYLHLGTPWVQGAMRLRKPDQIELDYVQRMMAWLLLVPSEGLADRRAVQLGLGAGTITKFCLQNLGMKSTAIEINPSVIAACQHWFALPTRHERLTVECADAGQYAAECDAGCADVVCIDLYDQDAAAPVLDDESFYADCYRMLAPGGVLSINLFGRDAQFDVSLARIAKIFGPRCVARLRPTREGNTVVLAGKLEPWPSREVLAKRADRIDSSFGLPARKWLRMIHPLESSGSA